MEFGIWVEALDTPAVVEWNTVRCAHHQTPPREGGKDSFKMVSQPRLIQNYFRFLNH